MAQIPGGFSSKAFAIECAIHEGRDGDARNLIYQALSAGNADRQTQQLAARYFEAKTRSRGRPKAAPAHWFDIGTEFYSMRGQSVKYEDALRLCAEKFGRSKSGIRSAIKYFDEAKQAHDEASAE